MGCTVGFANWPLPSAVYRNTDPSIIFIGKLYAYPDLAVAAAAIVLT